jgi:hypothetical protein
MTRFLPLLALLAGAVLAALPAGASAAQTSAPPTSVSTNWAGYAVHGAKFQRAAATWTAPAATCTLGSHTFSAFWVGIGGYNVNATGLEQIGTEADCDTQGTVFYTAWYELVPAGPVTLKFPIAANDQVTASVQVNGRSVLFELDDLTSGQSYTKRLRMADPDITSAEWIAEAPSECDTAGNCAALPLTNFGTVNFTGANATNTAGHTGVVTDPAWTAVQIDLQSATNGHHRRFAADQNATDATPTALDAAGSSFSVSYVQVGQQEPASQPQSFPGFGIRRG